MASLSFYQGGDWVDFEYEFESRKPKIEVTYATPQLVKFTLTETDASIANAIRRIILAEVPTMAIEIVNVEDNDSVLFDEFIAHRLGLFPLASHGVGDIPPDVEEFGFREHRHCNCFDGCPFCTVEFKLDVTNNEDKVLNVTHFDMLETGRFEREDMPEEARVQCLPHRRPGIADLEERRENGILVTKLKKNQSIRMTTLARKGIPKYHAKFNPTATCCMRYDPIIKLDEDLMNECSLDEKIDFVQSCPQKVFVLDGDRVLIEKLEECVFCDECVTKGREYGKKNLVVIKQNQHHFNFIVESVTPDGPRSVIDVVAASLRILDYKLSLFIQDAFGDEIKEWLPYEATRHNRRMGGSGDSKMGV